MLCGLATKKPPGKGRLFAKDLVDADGLEPPTYAV